MNQAIRGQRNWAGSNTTVFTTDNGLESTVYLHGNHIATYFHYDRVLQLFDGGWQSVTTKSRLNALLDEFKPQFKVFQKNWHGLFQTAQSFPFIQEFGIKGNIREDLLYSSLLFLLVNYQIVAQILFHTRSESDFFQTIIINQRGYLL